MAFMIYTRYQILFE